MGSGYERFYKTGGSEYRGIGDLQRFSEHIGGGSVLGGDSDGSKRATEVDLSDSSKTIVESFENFG